MSESGHPAMTQDALVSSYGGESMAHMRYLIFADIAEKEGFKNVRQALQGHSVRGAGPRKEPPTEAWVLFSIL
ncbi:MAG: hypothetical protein MGAcid_15150 [uncultured Acidilobus sp. MG]|nr:MAG: hypothetical protein MGAcid_15150 [uncultured Acidilobus sp. MG]